VKRTLYKSGNNMNLLISKFKSDISSLRVWCEMNKLDINWSKTFIMFVNNKRIKLPTEIGRLAVATVAVVSKV
jgi:hypothetical protein